MAHYGTLEGANAYNEERGRAAWATRPAAERTAALVRGSDYIDQRYRRAGRCHGGTFPGVRTDGRAQAREWPRTGAYDRTGATILVDEIPVEVEHATYEAAFRELLVPSSLSPDYVAAEQVTREKVGPIEVAYGADGSSSGGAPNRPVVTVIDEILAPVLTREPCIGVMVV